MAENKQPILGEVIGWDSSGRISYYKLREALEDAGLDSQAARKMLPRNAFARAAHKLEEQRVIRLLKDEKGVLEFQFTAENIKDEIFQYEFETVLKLNKSSGEVESTVPKLTELTKQLLEEEMSFRRGQDVSAIIRRLIRKATDYFRFKAFKGAVFIPKKHVGLVDQLEDFLRRLGKPVERLELMISPNNKQKVKEAVSDGIRDLIEEHRAAVDAFTKDTREATWEKAAERYRQTRFKLEAYACYLEDESNKLADEIEGAEQDMRIKAELLVADAEYD